MENLVKGNFEPSQQYSEYYEFVDMLDHDSILEDEK